MRLRYTPLALQHIAELKRFSIDRFGKDVANATLPRIRSTIDDLRRFPERGRSGRVAGTRELMISGTPFIVAYRVMDDRIEILAVLHGARKWPSSLQ